LIRGPKVGLLFTKTTRPKVGPRDTINVSKFESRNYTVILTVMFYKRVPYSQRYLVVELVGLGLLLQLGFVMLAL